METSLVFIINMIGPINLFLMFSGLQFVVLRPTPPTPQFTLNNIEATQISNYMWELNPDPVMLATFMQESGLNPRSKSKTNDRGICQLHYQRGFNKTVIDDDRWTDWKRQSEQCVWKRQNAPHTIWNGFKSGAYKKFLPLFIK